MTFCISDSLIYNMIPYSKMKAKQDIENGKIYYLQIGGGSDFLDIDDYECLEKQFGFEYFFVDYRLPREYLEKALDDYNSVVFEYLDEKCNCNFIEEYQKECSRLIAAKLESLDLDKRNRKEKKRK